jgi:hypothetical protein
MPTLLIKMGFDSSSFCRNPNLKLRTFMWKKVLVMGLQFFGLNLLSLCKKVGS